MPKKSFKKITLNNLIKTDSKISTKKSYTIVHQNFQKYFILDNGGTPFIVYVGENQVYIYRRCQDKEISECVTSEKVNNNYRMYTKLIKKYKFNKIFIGKSPRNKMTKFSGGYGKLFDGNSILLHICIDKYIFIGQEIFSFISYSEIIKFVSPVGNSSVPYPYAIDKDSNVYLFIEDVVIKNVPKNNLSDPYDYYYNNRYITNVSNNNNIDIDYFHDIIKFKIGNQDYSLNYQGNPEKHYDHINKPMYIVKTDKKKYRLSKLEYVKLIKDYGKFKNYKNFKYFKLIQPRI